MKNDNTKILIAAAAGAAAGVVAGILMAPSNGRDSREGLLKIANQVAEGVNGQIGAYLEKFGSIASLLGGTDGSNDTNTTSVGADATTGTTAEDATARG